MIRLESIKAEVSPGVHTCTIPAGHVMQIRHDTRHGVAHIDVLTGDTQGTQDLTYYVIAAASTVEHDMPGQPKLLGSWTYPNGTGGMAFTIGTEADKRARPSRI